MNNIFEYCCLNKIIASFYCDKDNTNAHFTGYVVQYNESEVLIAHINSSGLYDGFILKQTDDFYRIDLCGEYEKKIETLYKIKKQHHPNICVSDANIIDSLFNFSIENNLVVSFEFNGCTISGFIKNISEYLIRIDILNEKGEVDGESVFDINEVSTISVDTDEEQDLKFLSISIRGRQGTVRNH